MADEGTNDDTSARPPPELLTDSAPVFGSSEQHYGTTRCFQVEHAELQADLMRGRCYWSGTFYRDYSFHVANSHPLLSCMLCHPKHPYSKVERFVVLLIVLSLSILPCAVLGHHRHKNFWTLAYTCIMIFLFITLPVMALSCILGLLAVLDYHVEKLQSPTLQWMGKLIRAIKGICFAGTLIFCSLVVGVSILILKAHQVELWHATRPLVFSQLQCWVLWFLPDLLMPCCGFIHCWYSERDSRDSLAAEGKSEK